MQGDEFEWDDAKADENKAKHGVPFAWAVLACQDRLALWLPDPCDHEDRYRVIGDVGGLLLLFVIATDRGERIRIISARRATPAEQALYLSR